MGDNSEPKGKFIAELINNICGHNLQSVYNILTSFQFALLRPHAASTTNDGGPY